MGRYNILISTPEELEQKRLQAMGVRRKRIVKSGAMTVTHDLEDGLGASESEGQHFAHTVLTDGKSAQQIMDEVRQCMDDLVVAAADHSQGYYNRVRVCIELLHAHA